MEFDRPPIIPEQVAQTEYYRPNPAAFQKRINDNPYAVDVGFSSLENPIYTKLDDFPARMNTRANSQFYNPQEEINHRNEYVAPTKPFAQRLNSMIAEKAASKGPNEWIMMAKDIAAQAVGFIIISRRHLSHRLDSLVSIHPKHLSQTFNQLLTFSVKV